MINYPHKITAKKLCSELEVDPSQGLSQSEVEKRLKTYGENVLKKHETPSWFAVFLSQFLDPVIYVLIVATVLAFVFEEWLEGVAVAVVILLTALIGFIMEWQAIRSIEALRKMSETMVRVRRGGKEKKLEASQLVPGDVLLLQTGDVVPADARLLEEEDLGVKEAALTGESTQIDKDPGELDKDTPLADRTNMVFNGTIVTRGKGLAVVTHTGDKTELGKISLMSQEAEKEQTPLQKKLAVLSRKLIILTLILAIIIVFTGYIRGKSLMLMIETGIALAVAAIPEGLPIVATIALARGMLRLSKKNVIIKKLEAVQTLGETGIICTDKTGTLTENEMAVNSILLPDDEKGIETFDSSFEKIIEERSVFQKLIEVAVLCNNVTVEEGQVESEGDPVELALVEFALEVGLDPNKIRKDYPEEVELPFDTERKMMATLNKLEDGYQVCAKGALENLLDQCTHIQEGANSTEIENKEDWLEKSGKLASQGLRTLAFAFRKTTEKPSQDDLLKDLTFLGLVGFLDPARTDVKETIQIYQNAGVKVVMVTGDHPGTARKIAEDITLISEDAPDEATVLGSEIKAPEETAASEKKRLLNAQVFSRMNPRQKLDLVEMYQKNNQIVGMLGDGVNDAPALKKADIGIAMGIRGTEAAKEVADVILKDDKFTSTELAIRQGRTIFLNIRKFVVYLLSSNLAEIISVAIASLSNLPLPLMPLQILFLNLVTDVFPALALGMGGGEKDIMKQKPRDPNEPIMTSTLWRTTVIYGLSITAGVLGITFYSNLYLGVTDSEANNMAFYTLVLAQLLNVFNLPRRDVSFFINEVTKNRWVWGAIILCLFITASGYVVPTLREVLSLVPLTSEQLLTVVIFAFGSLLLAQICKRLGFTE